MVKVSFVEARKSFEEGKITFVELDKSIAVAKEGFGEFVESFEGGRRSFDGRIWSEDIASECKNVSN